MINRGESTEDHLNFMFRKYLVIESVALHISVSDAHPLYLGSNAGHDLVFLSFS